MNAYAFALTLPEDIPSFLAVLGELLCLKLHETEVQLGRTSLGMRISAGRIDTPGGPISHFAISCKDESMSRKNAACVARLILKLSGIRNQRFIRAADRAVKLAFTKNDLHRPVLLDRIRLKCALAFTSSSRLTAEATRVTSVEVLVQR